jgi:2-polyprenyl-3-methyl-5-hydroxy-6-metoxy-1,4-benzoquinol methylase
VEQPYLDPLAHCPICGQSAFAPFLRAKDHTLTQETFTLCTCTTCGFCATSPRPGATTIARYYDSPNYISHSNAKAGAQARLYQWARKRAIRSKHQLIARSVPSGSILDMGCGTGEFLGYLKSRGYATSGIEPSLSAREQAIRNHGLFVVPNIDQIPAREQFQVITLWHVLEHVHDVPETLKKIHARLSPGGTLIIAVPDRDSWDARHYGEFWAAYDVPRHLSHFRRQDLTRALSTQGLQIKEVRGMWFDAPYVSMLSERYRGASPAIALMKGALIGGLSNLIAASTGRPTSSSLYIAQKP